MIDEVSNAALMSENKHLANPCVTDSTRTSANQEDPVSMATHGAFRLVRMAENLKRIIAIELLCAAQGVEFRAPLKTSASLRACIGVLREEIPPLKEDRFLPSDIERATDFISFGACRRFVSGPLPELA